MNPIEETHRDGLLRSLTIQHALEQITVDIYYHTFHPYKPCDPYGSIRPYYPTTDLSADPTENGVAAVHLLRALLHHLHEKIPTLTRVEFQDFSVLETEEDDLPLRFYWIAQHPKGETWFETHFGAIHRSPEAHAEYRRQVTEFLTSPLPYHYKILRNLPRPHLLTDDKEMFAEVEQLFTNARNNPSTNSYRALFESIPEDRFYAHAKAWILDVVYERMKWVLERPCWYIDVPTALRRTDPPVPYPNVRMDAGVDMWRAQWPLGKDMDAWKDI
jgi:hypothetical protein